MVRCNNINVESFWRDDLIMIKRTVCLAIAFTMLFVFSVQTNARDVGNTLSNTAQYIEKTVTTPRSGETGGEWSVLGISRSARAVNPAFREGYLKALSERLKNTDGKLHKSKSTEYSRAIIALSALRVDCRSFNGYNLLSGISDMEFISKQGLNGAIFALIALDTKCFPAGQNATRQSLINEILTSQNIDGGFSITSGVESDIDLTAMALQSLAPYKQSERIKKAIEKALVFLSKNQNPDGTFSSYATPNCESCAQVITALSALEIDADNDPRFKKNGKSVLNGMLEFMLDDGSFSHADKTTTNLMATEQALYSLVAYNRYKTSRSSLYDMSDYVCLFDDISQCRGRDKICFLNKHGVINGVSKTKFSPTKAVTRAEFCTMLVKSLKLENKGKSNFSDVKSNDWFYPYVSSAFECGIVNGKSKEIFAPNSEVTREEACVMLFRAAKKFSSLYHEQSVDVKTDNASDWAKQAIAFCVSENICNANEKWQTPLTREQLAEMFYEFWFLM